MARKKQGNKSAGSSAKVSNVAKKRKRSSQPTPEEGSRKVRRRQERLDAKHRGKRQHDGEDTRAETRMRLQAKILERKISRLSGTAPAAERCALLQELGQLQMTRQWMKPAIEAFQQALELQPQDPGFVRVPLLCGLMDQARSQEASDLLKGPLFEPLLATIGVSAKAGSAAKKASEAELVLPDVSGSAAGAAVTIGCYSLALLSYISVHVLEEHGRNPQKAAAAEQRLLKRLVAARKRNPFVAEYLAFTPAFEPHFPEGAELPLADACTSEELPLLEALDYCCRYRQATVWLDSDEQVRRFLRCTLFEEDEEEVAGDAQAKGGQEEPPFGLLPEPAKGESALLVKWRKAREAALELWASEMSVEGGSEGEEQEGGDEAGEDAESEVSSADSSEAMAALEDRLSMG